MKQTAKLRIRRYGVSESIAWQQEPTEGYIYIDDIKNNYFYKLEDVAKDIWMCIVAGNDVQEMCSIISKSYGTSVEVVAKDLTDFLSQLEFKEIILPL